MLPIMSLLGGCLLAASLPCRPVHPSPLEKHWIGSILAWIVFVTLGGLLTMTFDTRLPLLVGSSGAFTPLTLAWGSGLLLLFALGAVLSARNYLRSGDTLPGSVSFTQMVTAFALLMAICGKNRYGLSFFLDRFVVIGGFLAMQFGLLSEYVSLFECERDKSHILEEAAAALRESHERLMLAERAGRVGVFDWEMTGGKTFSSAVLEELFGLPIGGFKGNYSDLARLVHAEDLARMELQLQEWTRARFDSFEADFGIDREGDGEHRRLHVDARLSYAADGTPLRMIGTCQDTTERWRAQQELERINTELEMRVAERTRYLDKQRAELEERNLELRETYIQLKERTGETLRALEELREKDRILIHQSRLAAMGEVIMNIAHEWRQPLNVLALIVQQLAMEQRLGCTTPEGFQADTKKAMEVIGQMSRTIDDFGTFFRPDREPESFRVNDVLAKTTDMIQASSGASGLTIKVDAQDDLVLYGYPGEFSQVLLTILMNARDAIEQHAVAMPRVEIRIFREGEKGVVTIADNAGGIPEAIIDKIFEPFFTTKGPDKGTGVGLYMSKNLIERHMCGSLTVRNTGDGTEFRIEI
jgi:signal transduction histidine kinase